MSNCQARSQGGQFPPNSESYTNNFQLMFVQITGIASKNLSDFSCESNLIKALWLTNNIVHDYSNMYSVNAGEIMPYLTLPDV